MSIVKVDKIKVKKCYLDTETRAEIMKSIRDNSAIVDGRRSLLVEAHKIGKEHGVRTSYVFNCLYTLRNRDAAEAAIARAEEEKRKAEEEIGASMREAAAALGVYSTVPSEPEMVASRLDKLESLIELVLDRLDLLNAAVADLKAKWE